MEQLEELRLIKMAKRGNIDAFGRLYENVYKDLYRFAFFMLKDAHDAEDVVSDTVTDAFEGIGRLRKDEAFRGWIFRILANKCKRMLKGYAQRPVIYQYDEKVPGNKAAEWKDRVTDEKNIGSEDMLDLQRAFKKLAQEDRLIIGLSFFGGYNSQEIAEILGKKPGTVRSRQSRALSQMKQELSGSYSL